MSLHNYTGTSDELKKLQLAKTEDKKLSFHYNAPNSFDKQTFL